MGLDTLLPDPALVRLDSVAADGETITLSLSARRSSAPCPDCQQLATRVHSRYARRLMDRPWGGVRLQLHLRTRRFFCDRRTCVRRIFTERFPGLLRPHARRTIRLWNTHQLLAYALGGEAGARIAAELEIAISADTLLDQLRQAPSCAGPAPRILGVDDFAFRKGQVYGTLLVDLERGEPIDLLPDRKAETLAEWLKEHPGVEVVTRDRGGNYADGIQHGAPNAAQVADRWHLLKNLMEALEASLAREQQALAAAARPAEAAPSAPSPEVPPQASPALPTPGAGTQSGQPAPPPTRAEQDRTRRRDRRRAIYEEVVRLHREGHTLRDIARLTGKARHTVRKYVQADTFPEIKQRQPRPTQLAPYHAYLTQRWEEGCHNAAQLFREIQEEGYTGGCTEVRRYLAGRRARLPPEQRRTSGPQPRVVRQERPPAPRAVIWWLLSPAAKLTAEQSGFLARLKEHRPAVGAAQELVQDFFRLVRQRKQEELEHWVAQAEQSGIAELRNFGRGLRRDWEAVRAALGYEWSNGPTEGQVNRLKLVKRSMYGRAGFALLRARVLPRRAVA